jgi:hypothetical protein
MLLGGLTILALSIGGLLFWWHGRAPIPSGDVEGFLDKTMGGVRVQFFVVQSTELRLGDNDEQVSFLATARTLQPLYSQIDTSEYLRRTFQLDSDSTAEARLLLADKGSPQGELGPYPADPYAATILNMNSPTGALFSFRGVIAAHRESGAWNLSQMSGAFEGPAPQGQPRSTFGDNSFAVGDSGDDARLRVLASEFQAFAGRVAEMRRKIESAKAAEIGRRRDAFMAQFAAGSIFRGTALEAGTQVGIAALPGDHRAFRGQQGDGPPAQRRRLERRARLPGAHGAPTMTFAKPTLNLTSPPDQAVRNAGPVPGEHAGLDALAERRPEGRAVGTGQLLRVSIPANEPRDQASALKVRLEAELQGSIAATEPSLLYLGTAVSRASGATEPILLRFIGHSNNGTSVESRLESTTRSWKRPLHGSIITNARRSGGRPIVMQTSSGEAVTDAPPDSVLGQEEDLEMHLGLEAGSLVGEDEEFRVPALPLAGESDLHRMKAEGEERARRFLGVFRSGIVYDGILHEEQGFVTGARLEILRSRPANGLHLRAPSLLVSSQASTGSFSARAIRRAARCHARGNGPGHLDGDDDFNLPLFKSAAAATVHLELDGNSIMGGIEGDPSWVFDFPAAAFLSAPSESVERRTLPPADPCFPRFPRRPAPICWPGGPGRRCRRTWAMSWSRPRARRAGFSCRQASRPRWRRVSTRSQSKRRSGRSRTLNSPEPIPGPNPAGRPLSFSSWARLRMECPRSSLLAPSPRRTGKRRVEVMGGPGVKPRFGYSRLPAYVRQVAPGFIMLTTTSALEPGPYVLNADQGYELIQD